MIVKSKAILPKASKATGIYPAIVVNLYSPNNSAFTYLQFFCPDVMNGTPKDAKYVTTNNWVAAPKGPHNGATYDFAVGCLITVSFQDGNLNSPQFVNFIVTDQSVIDRNAAIVGGADITADQLFDLQDISLTLETPGLQKGVALLPAIKASSTGRLYNFHTYGTKAGTKTSNLTIYRTGLFGTERVFKNTQGFISGLISKKTANFDYLDKQISAMHGDNASWLGVIHRLIKFELDGADQYKSIVDVANATTMKFNQDEYKQHYIDRNNIANKLLWYTMLAGYTYNEENMSKISSGWASKVKEENLKPTELPKESKVYNAITNIYASNTIAMYRGYNESNTNTNSTELSAAFIQDFYDYLIENLHFSDQIHVSYAIIVSNNLFSMRTTYGADNTANKILVICAVIATAFPVLHVPLNNFSLMSSDRYEKSILSGCDELRDFMKDGTKEIPSEENLAEFFTNMYFQELQWSKDDSYVFRSEPASEIKTRMKACINYVISNWSALEEVLKDVVYVEETGVYGGDGSPSSYGLVWPFPGVTTITSPFGAPRGDHLHGGIDIAIPGCDGKDIIAAGAGTVITVWSISQSGGYGNCVIIRHSDSLLTLYAHLKTVNVSQGATVSMGQKIGTCGNTGNSRGSHLHFEVQTASSFNRNKRVNPLNYVGPNNTMSNPSAPKVSYSGGYFNVNLPHDLQDYLFQKCNQRGIPVPWMIATIDHESTFDQYAQAGDDYGYCQVNKYWLQNTSNNIGLKLGYGKVTVPVPKDNHSDKIYDAKINIDCGTYIMQDAISQAGGKTDYESLKKAAFVYNTGGLNRNGGYRPTYVYVVDQMNIYDKYK